MSKVFKALIVDDERLARNELNRMLKDFSEIEVAAEASDIASAKQCIADVQPDVIFLDIQMPGESGFDLINSVPIDSQIIFVTAFDEYAIRAFEINALDYLLKPVNPKRLQEAVGRLNSTKDAGEGKMRKLDINDRLLLVLNNTMQFIKINTIIFINAAGDYTELKTTSGLKGITLKPIKEWEYRLPENTFVRIHRSTIINMEFIDRFEEWFNNAYRVYLKQIDEPFTVSRRYAAKLKERFS
jgi:two-component system LytT family response regulator